MLRVRCKSCAMYELFTRRSYSASLAADASPDVSAWKIARAAKIPDCMA